MVSSASCPSSESSDRLQNLDVGRGSQQLLLGSTSSECLVRIALTMNFQCLLVVVSERTRVVSVYDERPKTYARNGKNSLLDHNDWCIVGGAFSDLMNLILYTVWLIGLDVLRQGTQSFNDLANVQ
jgi:hypothetical protein